MMERRGLIARVAVCGAVLVVVGGGMVLFLLPTLVLPASASNEAAAIAGLRAYLGAQGVFQRKAYYGDEAGKVCANPKDGQGFPDLYKVGEPEADGGPLKLIDRTFAEATSPARPKSGYYFVDITADADGPYDPATDCGLCAVPARYKKSGVNTYIINFTGTVYYRDNDGKPVTTWPDVEKEGWKPVGQ